MTILLVIASAGARISASGDVVLYASDFTRLSGNWALTTDSSAAGGQLLGGVDRGWSSVDNPLASPSDYVEATFSAASYTPYHIWLRLRATANSKYNDSVWVQFSDAIDLNQNAVYPIGSTSGLLVNLEYCVGCGLSGWGWQDKASWLQQTNTVQFTTAGSHTIRIQTREDGVQVDQVVLSPAAYLNASPGQASNDSTIVAKTSATTSVSSPYSGTPAPFPGRINAETFDNGGEGIAYHDTSPANNGGQARNTGVDIELSSEGGYDIGWTAAGEWVNYTVSVAAAGTYNVQLRVASPSGALMHVGFTAPSSVAPAVNVPATGGWQNWTTVTVPVTLAAGTQIMTIAFDTDGVNFSYATASGGPPAPGSQPGAYSGSPAAVPGRIESEQFDNGPEGVAYHDTTPGNYGGQFRAGDVDIEASSDGGYDVGWTAPGEWLNYTVNVASAGNYTAQIRVASPNGATMHIGFNTASSVWSSVSVPATGGWQSWTTVSVPMVLGAGVQQMTVLFDTGGMNLSYVDVASGGTPPPPPPPPNPGGGTTVPVISWNIEINDNSESHARLAMDLLVQTGPQPQVIVIEEAYLTHFNDYIDELQRQTGRTWHGAFASHCASGDWNGSSCGSTWYQGVGIFTTYDIANTSSTLFPYADCWTSARAGLRAALNVNGTILQVFATHLQTGGCSNDMQLRYNSMRDLKAWAGNYSSPQIAAGDFNADPDQIDTTSGMLPSFVDTWGSVGTGSRFTAFGPNPSLKLDYWFADPSGRAVPQTSEVVYSTGGVSDHYPIQATFLIK